MKAICLTRVSTATQKLESQQEKVMAAAVNDGFRIKDIIVIANKESAVKNDEEHLLGINEMKTAIEGGDISCVYCLELSRLSRRPKVLYSIRDYLVEHRVNLICLNPYLKLLNDDYTINDSANVIFALYAAMNEQECKLRAERCMRGRLKAKEEGKFWGGKTRFGYRVVDKRYVKDPVNGGLVERIYKMYATGTYTQLGIAEELMSEGYFSNFASPLKCHNHISDILKFDYTGKPQNGFAYPRIISDELNKKVKDLLPIRKPRNKTKVKALGRRITFMQTPEGEFKYAHVETHSDAYKVVYDNDNQHMYVSRDCIDNIIWHYTKNVYDYKGRQSSSNKISNQIQVAERKREHLMVEIKKLKTQIDKIEERVIFGKLSSEKADELEKAIETQVNDHHSKYYELSERIKKLQETNGDSLEISDDMPFEDKDRLVHELIKRIEVTRQKRVYVTVTLYDIYGRSKTYNANSFWKIIYKGDFPENRGEEILIKYGTSAAETRCNKRAKMRYNKSSPAA